MTQVCSKLAQSLQWRISLVSLTLKVVSCADLSSSDVYPQFENFIVNLSCTSTLLLLMLEP